MTRAALVISQELIARRCLHETSKIKPEAFRDILAGFTEKITGQSNRLRLLAVDGSDIQIATNPDDEDTYFPGTNGQKPYSLIHLNALYDLEKHIYVDSRIQGRMSWNEHMALQEMVDKSDIRKALVIADRGYESYNNMAHIQEKGWFFLIRVKDGKHTYKANFLVAVHMCRLFFYERASPPDLETIIARNLIPIRPERHRTRNLTAKIFHGFLYRVA